MFQGFKDLDLDLDLCLCISRCSRSVTRLLARVSTASAVYLLPTYSGQVPFSFILFIDGLTKAC